MQILRRIFGNFAKNSSLQICSFLADGYQPLFIKVILTIKPLMNYNTIYQLSIDKKTKFVNCQLIN